MALDQSLIAELLKTLLRDLDEQSEALDDGLLKLERGALSDDERKDAYATILRSAHNLKGGARGLGLEDAVTLFHHMETLFARLRDNGELPSSAFVSRCFGAMEAVRNYLTEMIQGSSNVDLPAQIPLLDQALSQTADAAMEPAEQGAATKSATPAERPPTDIPPATAAPPVEQTAPAPAPATKSIDGGAAQYTRVQQRQLDRVSALAEEMVVTRTGMTGNHHEVRRLHSDLSRQLYHLKHAYAQLSQHDAPQAPDIERLFLHNLDTLAEFSQRIEQLQTNMRYSSSALSRLTKAMGHELQVMRLMPASSLLKPARMNGRSLANELGKQVEIELVGEDVAMDRLVLERLQAPLSHLLRNAIDHGIEFPEERRQQGKPEQGHIELRIESLGNSVDFSIRDDGRGIDVEAVTEAAIRKRLIDKEEAESMSREQKLQLILFSGLSSRQQVTQISGRGVGMDEVDSAIRALHGRLSIETTPNAGTCFSLHIPIMLAQERGLVVSAGGRQFVLPTQAVERVNTFQPSEIIKAEGGQAIMVDGRATPLRSLADVLGLEELSGEQQHTSYTAVTLGHGHTRITFLVEELESEQDIVIKPLAPPLDAVPNIKGATYDDKGNVLIAINVQELLQTVLQQSTARSLVLSAGEQVEQRPRILVVDDSLTTRTLEKNILEANGYDVAVCVNGQEAWNLLQSDELFDMVVTDIEMPQMNGFELTEAIKSHPSLRSLPVIIVTSLARDDHRRRGMEVGADAYIVKSSFESRGLLDTIGRLL